MESGGFAYCVVAQHVCFCNNSVQGCHKCSILHHCLAWSACTGLDVQHSMCAGMFARPMANGCGILGLLFSTTDSLIYNQLDSHGLPDSLSSVLAGG